MIISVGEWYNFPHWEGDLSSLGCWIAPLAVTGAYVLMVLWAGMAGLSHWHLCDANLEIISYSVKPSGPVFWLL